MENAKIIEVIIETKKDRYTHEVTMKKGEGDVLKRTLELIFKYINSYQHEEIINFSVNGKELPIHPFANLSCDIRIKLNNGGLTYNESYIYGPTMDKDFDLIGTPTAFLKNGLDWFDYNDVEEIELKVRRDR